MITSTVRPVVQGAVPTVTGGAALPAAVGYYRDRLGWPVAVEARTRRPVLIAGRTVDAITMPSAFGELVQTELGIMMLAGPVVVGPGEGPWTFLTRRANTMLPKVPPDLLALGVRLIPAGAHVVLPAILDGTGPWSWVAPPVPGRDPAIWSAVIGAARRVAARRAR